MFALDIGNILPLALLQDDRPFDLSGALSVELLLTDGSVLPLSVSAPTQGYVEYVNTGTLAPGFKRGNVRVRMDAQHLYHFDTCAFHVKVLGT